MCVRTNTCHCRPRHAFVVAPSSRLESAAWARLELIIKKTTSHLLLLLLLLFVVLLLLLVLYTGRTASVSWWRGCWKQ